MVDLYFNESSLINFESSKEVDKYLDGILDIYLSQKDKKTKVILNDDFLTKEWSKNYTPEDWLRLLPKDKQSLFRTIFINKPFFSDLISSIDLSLVEFSHDKFKGSISNGIYLSYLLKGILLSLPTLEIWNASEIKFKKTILSESNFGVNDDCEEITIFNISKIDHVSYCYKSISSDIFSSIRTGDKLLAISNQLFRNLELSEETRGFIKSLRNNDPRLTQIIDKLRDLDVWCSQSPEKFISKNSFRSKATPESESRIELLKEKLTFTTKTGNQILCSWHFRYTPGAGRIHFEQLRIDQDKKIIFVGYIGEKIGI